MKAKAIIVDLDGTLCNTDHRQHFLKCKPKQWKQFFDALEHDKPNAWCVELIDAFLSRGYNILFVTGRPDSLAMKTSSWFSKHLGFSSFQLFMRKQGDFRHDHIVKSEIYDEHIRSKYDVLFVVDDRASVVGMWRSLGLTCLQCDDGDF